MAHSALLPEAILKDLIEQLGEMLPLVFNVEKLVSGIVKLNASFKVWELSADYDVKPFRSFAELVADTGDWHHMIYLNGEPIGFAVSAINPPKKNSLTIQEVYKSEIAEKMDVVMAQVDAANIDSLTHLLILQNYQLYAFWLVDIKNVFIIDCPPEFHNITPGQSLDEDDFLSQLRSEAPIFGRIPDKQRPRKVKA